MEFMKSFMDQSMIAMMGEIVLFANTVIKKAPPKPLLSAEENSCRAGI